MHDPHYYSVEKATKRLIIINKSTEHIEKTMEECIEGAYMNLKENCETFGELERNIDQLAGCIGFKDCKLAGLIREKLMKMVKKDESNLSLR